MKRTRAVSMVVIGATLSVLAGCGSDDNDGASTSDAITLAPATEAPTSSPAVTTEPATTEPASSEPASSEPATTEPASSEPASSEPTTTAAVTTTTETQPAQVAIWPAVDTVFATPEAAAADFVTKVFGVSPTLGAFEQSDSRSGEISVLVGEGSAPPTPRSTLILRQLAPSDGWFVLAAVNDSMTIDSPAALATVPAGKLPVSGAGRGFEALIVVEAFVAGRADKLDTQTAMGGSAENPEPFAVTLDVSAAHPGDTVVLLIRGGVGLENDTGEFSALAVTIAG